MHPPMNRRQVRGSAIKCETIPMIDVLAGVIVSDAVMQTLDILKADLDNAR